MQFNVTPSQRLALDHLRAAGGMRDDESFILRSWAAFVALPVVVAADGLASWIGSPQLLLRPPV